MILKASQRGGAKQLGLHLLKDENAHVTVHEIRGFASDDVVGAMKEAYAVSKATRCKQFLFSVSLNPPSTENVSTEIFENTVEAIEQANGLNGQPRIIVFHEKEGRRHAHAVWSRIDADTMKARQLSFYKSKLREISKDLYKEHNWKMPKGFAETRYSDPRNYSLAEYQQAKRAGHDPKVLKQTIQDCWAMSDNRYAFAAALIERGLKLAAGRRGHVAVDTRGEVYAISRYANVRAKQVRLKLGETNGLPSVEKAQASLANDMHSVLGGYNQKIQEQKDKQKTEQGVRQKELVERQRAERRATIEKLEARRIETNKQRQARFKTGFKGLWERVNGEHQRIRKLNEVEAFTAYKKDQERKDTLIFQQLQQRRNIEHTHINNLEKLRQQQTTVRTDIDRLQVLRGKTAFNMHDKISMRHTHSNKLERNR